MSRRLISGLIGMLIAFTVHGTVIHIPADYRDIQSGIDAAVSGDTILIAPGTYTGTGNRDISYFGKSILVTSDQGPETCVLDCQGSEEDPHRGFTFENSEGKGAVLEGITIRNGAACG